MKVNIIAGCREPLRQRERAKIKNSKNKIARAIVKRDEIEHDIIRKIARADDQRNDRRQKRKK
jgi:hypothetical protein